MSNAAWVDLIAMNVPKGTSVRDVCPKCKGGSDNEKCLSVWVDLAFGVHWKCFRSTCNYTGGPRGVRNAFTPSAPKREPRYYTRPFRPLTEAQNAFFLARFALVSSSVAGYSTETDRFLLPVYGPNPGLDLRGYLARSFSGDSPKSLTYNEQPEVPFIHFACAGPLYQAMRIVVCEDWLSAEKVAQSANVVAVALNGTRLSQEMVTEISTASGGVKETYLALDKDAYAKSLTYIAKYREQFTGGLYVWKLEKDLKYVDAKAIREALRDGRTANFSSSNAGSKNL